MNNFPAGAAFSILVGTVVAGTILAANFWYLLQSNIDTSLLIKFILFSFLLFVFIISFCVYVGIIYSKYQYLVLLHQYISIPYALILGTAIFAVYQRSDMEN